MNALLKNRNKIRQNLFRKLKKENAFWSYNPEILYMIMNYLFWKKEFPKKLKTWRNINDFNYFNNVSTGNRLGLFAA